MKPWWKLDPSRLEKEMESLHSAGLKPTQIEREKEAGRMVLKIEYPDPETGFKYGMEIRYPMEFPFFPPALIAPVSFPKGKHIATDGSLCFFHDVMDVWDRNTDTAASITENQVPKILYAHRNPDKAADIEANVGVQVDASYDYEIASIILTNTVCCPEGVEGGHFKLRARITDIPSIKGDRVIHGTVEKVFDQNGNPISSMDPGVGIRWLGGNLKEIYNLTSPWFKMDESPPHDRQEIMELIYKHCPKLTRGIPKREPRRMIVVGIMYPVETGYTSKSFSWLFVALRKKHKAPENQMNLNLVKCDHISHETMLARAPKLAPLAMKKVAIFGVGAIGSTIAMQLARAGAKDISLIDFDTVSAGNFVRWASGLPAVGTQKVAYLAHHIQSNYPYVNAKPYLLKIGEPRDANFDDRHNQIVEALQNADIIVDATVTWSTNDYLSSMARTYNLPYIWASGTPGGYGGCVGRAFPDKETGCYYCFRHGQNDKSIKMPAKDPDDDITVQPVGCFDPTFTGTGLDMDQVSLTCARLVIATLCRGHKDGYPDFDWDIGVVDLWNEKGRYPIEPQWTTLKLTKHPDCKNHG